MIIKPYPALLTFFFSTVLAQAQNVLIINNQTVVGGDTAWVSIDMSNADDIAGFQFDLDFPEQITSIDSGISSNRFVDHELVVGTVDNYLRVLAYSTNLTPFSGDSGTVVTLGFITEPIDGDFTIEFVNPILGDPQYQNVLTGYQNGVITLDSPVPFLSPFATMEFMEDDNYLIYLDTLQAHVSDEDTPLSQI